MAVIQIPSKNIFSIDNPKIIDNIIDKIEINTNNTKIIVDKDGLSYTETVGTPMNIVGNYYEIADAQNYSINGKSFDESIVSIIEGSNARNATFQLLLYTEMRLGYLTIPIKIYKNTYSNKYITDVYYGVDQENQPRIEYTSVYNKAEIPTTGQWRYQDTLQKYPSAYDSVTFTIGSPSSARQTNGKILLDNLTDNTDNQVVVEDIEEKYDKGQGTGGNKIVYYFKLNPSFKPTNATQEVKMAVATYDTNISGDITNRYILLDNKTNVSNARVTKGKDEEGEYFYIELTVLCSRQITTLINPDYETSYYTRGSIPSPHPLTGTSYIDITSSVSFTFHGETIQLDVGELLKYVGKENGTNVFSVDTNELVQQSNTPLLEKYKKILEQYKDGKEIATLRCSIDDYYTDYYGDRKDKAIDIKSGRMSFHEHDKVIPYIYTANGVDAPMSQYKNGDPKVFEVLSSKIYYDGAVWQDLIIVESKE